MRPGRIIALVIGSLLALVGFSMVLGGAALGLATAFARDDDGYFEYSLDRIESDSVAVISDDLTFAGDSDAPDWLLDVFDLDVKLRATNTTGDDVFVGIARTRDVDDYLAGVDHDIVTEVDDHVAVLRNREGGDQVDPPGEQDIWDVDAEGAGTQTITWEASSGSWTALVMNADGSPGISTDVEIGARAGFLVPLVFVLLGLGLLFLLGGVALIVFGAVGLRGGREPGASEAVPPPPPSSEPDATPDADGAAAQREPVSLNARLDPDVSRWQWLVKWFLAIPHLIVLFFLWIALVVLTIVAGFAVLFTKRYPHSLFAFNVGVLRWSWRVTYYAFTGGLGTDRYPPFTLEDDPSYPARLDVEYPGDLSRGLVLVKWWLLAIPHFLIVAVFLGWSGRIFDIDGDAPGNASSLGLLTALTIVAAVALLFRGRHLRPLYDFIVGVNRWIYRVGAYVLLMTDRYPPFRLDQGDAEPDGGRDDRVSAALPDGPAVGSAAGPESGGSPTAPPGGDGSDGPGPWDAPSGQAIP